MNKRLTPAVEWNFTTFERKTDGCLTTVKAILVANVEKSTRKARKQPKTKQEWFVS